MTRTFAFKRYFCGRVWVCVQEGGEVYATSLEPEQLASIDVNEFKSVHDRVNADERESKKRIKHVW